jgi:hypothetical protein
LNENNLTSLPEDLSMFKNLQRLDIRKNKFKDINSVVKALSSLPNLIDLEISLSQQEEVFIILKLLPNLKRLNGKPTREDSHTIDLDEKEVSPTELNNDINNFNSFFDKISIKIKFLGKDSQKNFYENFQELLQDEIADINNCVENNLPNYLYATKVNSLKVKVFNFFTENYLKFLELKDKESSIILSEMLSHLNTSSNQLSSKD